MASNALTDLERRVENEVLFRRVNETIEAATDVGASTATFLCECSDANCRQTLELPIVEYEEVRHHAARFIVRPEHEVTDDIGRVVERRLEYSVIEKIGYAAALARASYPRDRKALAHASPQRDQHDGDAV